MSEASGKVFLRAVGILASGTASAQVVMAGALWVAARLYTPGDFSVLAVFTAIVSVCGVVACLRFDIAIPIPQEDREAINLLALALGSALLMSAILVLGVFFVPSPVLVWLNQPKLEPYLWLIPIGVMLMSSYSALQFWFVRKKEFHSIASSRITQSGAGACTQIGFGWIHGGAVGLLLGQVLNSGIGSIPLAYKLIKTEWCLFGEVGWKRMCLAFSRYKRFPQYSTFEALFNSAGIQLPIILIAAYAIGPEAGYLSLAMYVMQAPMALIGSAISQVYMSQAPTELHAGRLGPFTATVFGGLIKSGVGPLIFAGIIAPDMFGIIFGEKWRRAGDLVLWMTPWFIVQFLSSPISMALHILGRQRAALVLQFFGLIVRMLAVWGAAKWASALLVEAYALSGLLFYLVYLIVVLMAVGVSVKEIIAETRRGGFMIVVCIGIAITAKYLVKLVM